MATTKTKDETPQTRWSKEISDGNMTKRLSVESVENGFIITINKYGNEGEGEKRKYIDETKRFISEDNPFAKEEEEGAVKTNSDTPCCAGTRAKVLSAMKAIGDMNGLISTL